MKSKAANLVRWATARQTTTVCSLSLQGWKHQMRPSPARMPNNSAHTPFVINKTPPVQEAVNHSSEETPPKHSSINPTTLPLTQSSPGTLCASSGLGLCRGGWVTYRTFSGTIHTISGDKQLLLGRFFGSLCENSSRTAALEQINKIKAATGTATARGKTELGDLHWQSKRVMRKHVAGEP